METHRRLISLIVAFVGYTTLFNEWTARVLPKEGVASLFVSPQAYFILASLLLWKVWDISWEELGLTTRRWRRDVLLGASMGMVPIILTLLGMASWPLFSAKPIWGGEPLPFEFSASHLVILWALAPISEELFFRGFVLRALCSTYPALIAVVFSAVMFMLVHGGFAPGPLILGLVTAPVVLRTRSILPAIVFHAISNLYVPVMLVWFPNLYRQLAFFFR